MGVSLNCVRVIQFDRLGLLAQLGGKLCIYGAASADTVEGLGRVVGGFHGYRVPIVPVLGQYPYLMQSCRFDRECEQWGCETKER
jgi:hypothetical protein